MLTEHQKVILEIATQFPNASSRAISRMAYRENPALWANVEACRKHVVRMRNGDTEHKSYLTPTPFTSEEPWGSFPEGKKEIADWKPFEINGEYKALIIGDLHIPFHERRPILNAIEHGRSFGTQVIILNGDISDFFALSRWEKNPKLRKFKEELNTVREFLSTLREQFPKARIVYKLGNHEERYISYMRTKAPELIGVDKFEIGEVLELKDHGIELVADKQPIRLGQLNVVHGHEYRFAISNPVSPARGLFLKARAYAVCNHFHQKSEHSARTIENKRIMTWSIACLCQLHPEYAPLNDWSHGFATVEVFRGGKFSLNNKTIGTDGQIY